MPLQFILGAGALILAAIFALTSFTDLGGGPQRSQSTQQVRICAAMLGISYPYGTNLCSKVQHCLYYLGSSNTLHAQYVGFERRMLENSLVLCPMRDANDL